MVSLVPLPLGKDIQGLIPSPITKMLDTLRKGQQWYWRGWDLDAPSSESPVKRILHVNNVESTNVLLPVYNDTSTAHVTSTSDHDNVSRIKLDKVNNLARLELELDGVVDLDGRIGVTDGAPIVGDNMRDTLGSNGNFADFEELVAGFLSANTVDSETALNIIKETEVLARFLKGDNIYRR